MIGILLTKLVNEKQLDWDEHMNIIMYAYWTTFKVTTRHTPYELVYGLHPLMPTKYVLPANPQTSKDFSLVQVLATRLS
jgi:hypothetical protein